MQRKGGWVYQDPEGISIHAPYEGCNDKVGLKSKTVARMSETYFDQNSTETIAGYPAAMMSFIDKYRRMRW